jgi:D-sedoheptulose 7-phosphate isomerase
VQNYIRASLREGAEARTKLADACSESIEQAARRICESLRAGGKLLIFGNGGSAADAQHMAAELVGRFLRERAGLPAIALTTDSSVLTSLGNDYGFEQVFARQVKALSRAADVAIGISTSGNSLNVLEGLKTAREMGMSTIVLSGGTGGEAAKLADVALIAPSKIVWQIQECHTAVIHVICGAVEEMLAGSLGE